MYQLLQLAAQHAGVDDIFHTLVPRWALGTLFDRILNCKNADHTPLTTTWFQQWILSEGLNISPKAVLDFFMRSPSVETISKHEFVHLLRANNLLYHSMRRRVEGVFSPEEVLLQREEVRNRNKQAAAAVKHRIRHIPDKTALYLSKGRIFFSTSMATEFGRTFGSSRAYLPPSFQTTAVATATLGTGTQNAKNDMRSTAAFPSAWVGITAGTCCAGNTLTGNTLTDSTHQLLPDTRQILASVRKCRSTRDLCQKSERSHKGKQDGGDAVTALNSPVIATVKKPAAYRLTNGMIGGGKPHLSWAPETDEDSVVLPALPLTISEEPDPVKKHIDQVNATVRRSKQRATLASLTDFRTERQEEGRAHPSMIDLPDEVWRAMVANSKRIVWPGQAVEFRTEVIVNERGEEETVDAGPAHARSASKAAILNAAIRLQKTKRLRQLFEQMDKNKTGTLTLDQFREYMARENPRSVKRAAEIFAAMQSKNQDHSQEDTCKVPTVSFIEMLRVFFPETTEIERRQLAVAVPPSVSPCTGLYDCLELDKLVEQVYAKYLPPRTDAYRKVMWESVRQLIGALGLGDYIEEESRNQLFDQLDVDGNGKIDQKDILLWYLDMMDDHESASCAEGVT